MEIKSKFFTELIVIIATFGFIFLYTFIFYVSCKIYRTFSSRFGKKIAKDVERDTLESWESRDS